MAADFDRINDLTKQDIDALKKAEISYGDSWRKRGGIGAFMMLARKWDRIENQTNKQGYDMFAAIFADTSDTGLLDDIRDLRRYLLLVHLLSHLRNNYLLDLIYSAILLEEFFLKIRSLYFTSHFKHLAVIISITTGKKRLR